jgi:NitT/TauT family transport system substrate-binding protein
MKNLKSILLAAAAAVGLAGGAAAKDTVSFAYLADPSIEAAMWAINNGKVTSDLIEIESTALEIPALIQATVGQTYDVVMTAGMAVPRAVERGLPLRIIAAGLRTNAAGEGSAIWVPKGSDIASVEDLKGKKLAVYSLGSSGITLVRIALAEVYGIDVSLEGGDIDFVEMPATAMPAALSTGRVDAATLIHAQAFKATQDGDFVPLVQTSQALQDETGLQMISAVLAGYAEKLDANPANYTEFLRMVQDSRAYALANPEEVFGAVGAEFDIDPAFFDTWFNTYMDFPGTFIPQDREALVYLWDKAIEIGALDSYPPLDEMTWQPESN